MTSRPVTGPTVPGVVTAAPPLSFAGVTRSFGRSRAVDAVSLTAGPGVVGLLGPNGAGKSTLLRIAATVLAPDRGEVRLLGLDPSRPDERLEVRRRLGYLPQAPGLYPGFTPFDLVDYVAVLKEHTHAARRREEVRRVLVSVGLEDDMHRKIRRLSGGTRQRVALAAALLGDPDLLVLDEPATGLDPEQRLRLRSLLSQARTVVMATHHIAEVSSVCHEVHVVLGGRVHFSGPPAGLAALAAGRVWEDDRPDPRAVHSWLTPAGTHRHVGEPPAGAALVAPTLDDGYLLLTAEARR
ncbi:ABC transporter ATP-binding protein [Nocardioides abyssi]|uniref:ATP-binding cassette domain-containing protein n=1 Tax=Nocardioides abyssi TaxID=3058370 RepID=A0ABT8EZD2_9ACTN|nr:ATP-binding cassette domain-containing protein [Nocardioides abyssi]MDN4163409.1 ATP-binding cassette domain-containing protein [Nocardioides abyssi]